MSKEAFAEAVRAGLKNEQVRERMAEGDFSDTGETTLTEHERSLLQAAAKELVENADVQAFDYGSDPQMPPYWDYTGTDPANPRFMSVHNAMNYLQP